MEGRDPQPRAGGELLPAAPQVAEQSATGHVRPRQGQPRQSQDADAVADRVDGDHCAGAGNSDEYAGQTGADDRGDRLGDLQQRVGVREVLRGNQAGHQGRQPRAEPALADSDHHRQHDHFPDRRPVGEQQHGQDTLGTKPEQIRCQHHRSGPEPVGEHSAEQQHDQDRQDPRRHHHADDVDSAAGQLQRDERGGDRVQPGAEQRCALADEKAAEPGVPQHAQTVRDRPGSRRGGRASGKRHGPAILRRRPIPHNRFRERK